MVKIVPMPVYEAMKGAVEIIAAKDSRIAALEAQLAGRVRVKPLEWQAEDIGWTAQTQLGEWAVDHDDDEDVADTPWSVWGPHESIGHFPSPEEARAAAQADFERRILSALEATQPALVVTDRPNPTNPTR